MLFEAFFVVFSQKQEIAEIFAKMQGMACHPVLSWPMLDEDSPTFLTVRELADLLRVRERKVYDLAAAGDVPCSRVTGKLLFPRTAVNRWLAKQSSGTGARPRAAVFAGSHDPLLEWSLKASGAGLATFFDGSSEGIERFERRDAVATALHLMSPDEVWNVPAVRDRFASENVVLLGFAERQRGLLVAKGVADSYLSRQGIDARRPRPATSCNVAAAVPASPANVRASRIDPEFLQGKRLARRQSGAGSQILLEWLVTAAGLALEDLASTELVLSESDAAMAVSEGRVDAALGLSGLARQHGLDFIPLMTERFDLLVDREAWFEPALQCFADFCRTKAFHDKATSLGGYDVSRVGAVRFNAFA